MKKKTMIRAAFMTALALTTSAITASMTAWAAFGLTSQNQTQTTDTYTFKCGETEIRMGDDALSVIAALGTPTKAVFETDSCAYQGKDKVYTYKDFEVSTFPKDGKECISAVVVTGSSVATPEGISIGSKASDVTKTYGASDGKYGIYRYTKGQTELTFYTTQDGSVEEIEYVYKQ